MLARLGHRAVGSCDDENSAVHLSCAGDHVLDVVGVTRCIDVRVVALFRLVLNMRDVDRDATSLFLGSLVDLIEGRSLVQVGECIRENLGDGRRRRGLAVVDVTNGADVHVRLRPLELRLRHFVSSWTVVACRMQQCGWLLLGRASCRKKPRLLAGAGWGARCAYSPVALAMISFETFAGTSA